jgi:plasmid stabilization system protein ParE
MQVRWTEPAAEDLYEIVRYIRRYSPRSACEVATKIYNGCESLALMPWQGRTGKVPGTR